jgi:hypothetical protein
MDSKKIENSLEEELLDYENSYDKYEEFEHIYKEIRIN